MTTTLRIAVPAGTVADASATGVAATEAVRAIGRIMRGRECRVEIDVAGAAPTLALELDGTNAAVPANFGVTDRLSHGGRAAGSVPRTGGQLGRGLSGTGVVPRGTRAGGCDRHASRGVR